MRLVTIYLDVKDLIHIEVVYTVATTYCHMCCLMLEKVMENKNFFPSCNEAHLKILKHIKKQSSTLKILWHIEN